jgi:polysaccharide chain length determinant protein (PEP-CTERM system associated)
VLGLPDIYRATARVLIERAQVPDEVVGTPARDDLGVQLETISQQVLSHKRLEQIIERFDLYPDAKDLPRVELAQRLRKEIELELTGADGDWGRKSTVAFTVSYRGADPQIVTDVTNAIAQLYVEENLVSREKQVSGTTSLIQDKFSELHGRLQEQEKSITDFKSKNTGALPDQVAANLAALERLNSQLGLNGERAKDARERLLKVDEGTVSATPKEGGLERPQDRLDRLKRQYNELRGRFSDKYPDVVSLAAEIKALEKKVGEGAGSTPGKPALSQREELVAELQRLDREEAQIRGSMRDYQARLDRAPLVGQQLEELTREQQMTEMLSQSLAQKTEEARMAGQREQRDMGRRFSVLDEATVPLRPWAPNVLLLLLVGTAVAGVCAVGSGLLAEQLDTTFDSADELRSFTAVPVLATIPWIETGKDRAMRVMSLLGRSVETGIVAGTLALLVYRLVHDNEQLTLLIGRVVS